MQIDNQGSSQTPEVLPPPRRSRAWLWIGGVLGVLCILGIGVGVLVGVMARSGGEELPPRGWTLQLDEGFTRANQYHWSLGTHVSLSDNTYRWEAEAEDDLLWWWDEPLSGPKVKDAYVVAEIRHHDPDGLGAHYGITFRSPYPGSKYMFEVYDPDHFEVVALVDDEWEPIVSLRETSAISADGVNTLAVLAKGTSLDFYINGVRVKHVDDDHITRPGKAGLIFGSTDGEHTIIEVMSFKVYTP